MDEKKHLRHKKRLKQEGNEIMQEIEHIKTQLAINQNRFSMATDDVLIDCYIYEIIALHKKYQYFLRLAKDQGIVAQIIKKTG